MPSTFLWGKEHPGYQYKGKTSERQLPPVPRVFFNSMIFLDIFSPSAAGGAACCVLQSLGPSSAIFHKLLVLLI
jgi:hypothetical protein